MPDDGSPRPRLMRRLLLAIARAIALLILVAGFSGALAIALPKVSPAVRDASALVAGVAIFETLRPRERHAVAAEAAAPVPLDSSEDLVEAHRVIEELRAEMQRTRDESQGRSDSLTHDVQDLLQINDGLRQQIDSVESTLAQARAKAIEDREKHEAESKNVQQAASKALDEIQKMRATNDQHRAQIDREKQNTAALQKTADSLQAEREKLQTQLSGFDKKLASAAQEMDGLRAERHRARREIDETRQQAEVDKAGLRASTEAEWRAKLQQASTGHAAAVESLRGENQHALREIDSQWNAELQLMSSSHAKERDEVQAEVRKLTARVAELQQQLEESRRTAQQLLSAGQDLTRQLDEERQRFQSDLHEALDRERQLFREQLDSRPLVDEKAVRESIDLEWGNKLQKIVNELTSDHEDAIGEHIEAREVAKAELRSLNLKVKALDQQLQSTRDGRLGLLQRDDQLTQQLDREKKERERLEQEIAALRSQAPTPTVDEKGIRDKVDAEWSEKLQTIVNHMASDHESDVGKAIEEREAARAEARNLAVKLSAMQQKLDGERQNREALAEKLRAANEEIVSLRTAPAAQPAPLPPSVMPTMPLPVIKTEDEKRAREEVLQFAEQAHEVLRRITSPGTEPVPADQRKARILFVHHDPALRTMWRDMLGKNGFEVHTAVDGLEGLRLAMAEKPDVVIADASMPKMDGRELCQLIKSNQETAGVKVILMTGIYTTEAPIPSATREFEADEMLRKPVKFEAMKSALTNILAARV